MKLKSILKFIWSGGWLLLMFVFLFIRGCIDDKKFEDNAVVATVVVEGYERKSVPGERGSLIVSVGHYFVSGWKYPCYYKYYKLKPIGATFKIKYNQEEPKEWRSVDE